MMGRWPFLIASCLQETRKQCNQLRVSVLEVHLEMWDREWVKVMRSHVRRTLHQSQNVTRPPAPSWSRLSSGADAAEAGGPRAMQSGGVEGRPSPRVMGKRSPKVDRHAGWWVSGLSGRWLSTAPHASGEGRREHSAADCWQLEGG